LDTFGRTLKSCGVSNWTVKAISPLLGSAFAPASAVGTATTVTSKSTTIFGMPPLWREALISR
jgi:hypothetical protein